MLLRAPHAPVGNPASRHVPRRRRVRWWLADRQPVACAVAAIAAIGTGVQGANLATAPAPASGEGALVAAGWSIVHLGSAGDATFSSVGPSLAPVHLGAWIWATGALGRPSSAVAGGREAMLAAYLVSIPLVWALARRSGLARWAAGGATLVFAASPLAVALHRPVHGAGLAVPWMLAALVLASARRPRTATVVAAGLCLAVAVLTESSIVVTAPAVGWLLWRSSPSARRRRRRLLTGAAGFGIAWLAVTALVTSGTEPAATLGALDRIRLAAGGATTTAGMLASGLDGRSVVGLVGLDRIGAGACLLAAVVVPSVVPRLRPVACAFWAFAALTLVSGEPSWIIVVAMVPLGAVLLAAGAQLVWAWHREARREPRRRMHTASPAVSRLDAAVPAVFAAAAVALALAVPDWIFTHRDLAAADGAAPLASARDWVADNLNGGDRVIVDDAMWVDLVENGLAPSSIAGYGAVGAGPDWHSYGYIVSTPATRDACVSPELARAVDSSIEIAGVGEGDNRVEVRRIGPVADPHGPNAAAEAVPNETQVAAGRALAANPRIEAPPASLTELRAGSVDERLTTVLATLAGGHRLGIAALVRLPGEDVAGAPVRTVELASIDGRPIAAGDPAVVEVVAFLGNQLPEFRPHQVSVVGRTTNEPRLRITFPIGQEDQG